MANGYIGSASQNQFLLENVPELMGGQNQISIVDALKSKIVQSSIKNNFNKLKKNYLLLTIHREENTLDPNKLKIIISSIQKICKNQKALENNSNLIFSVLPFY